jgi:hypothetical protein
MALILKDRVKETTAVTSTGTATLLGAVTGYQSFSVIGTGNTCYYTIASQTANEWEVGIGTYTSPNQLSRDTVLSSSNSGSLVNFSAGTKDVFVTYPAGKAVFGDTTDTAYEAQFAASNGLLMNNKTIATSYSIPSGYCATSAGPITVNSGITITVPTGSRWVVL